MSNPATFLNSYTNNIVTLINILEDLRVQNDVINQDPTIIDRYFAMSGQMGIRSDIAAADVQAAQAALVQILFTFDSGAPPQKAALYKMLP